MTYPSIIAGTDKPLSSIYQLALLDLDGVVYRGADPVEMAATGIAHAKERGMRIAYTTNNPSRFPSLVADQIRSFGVELSPDDIITSGIVAAGMLSKELKPGDTVLVIGGDHLRDELKKRGLQVCDLASDRPQAVIQSWYPDVSWRQLAHATYAIAHGARYFATNRDMTLPREGGITPGNGAMILPVVATTGVEPEASAGKPEAYMYDIARDMFGHNGNRLPVEACLPVGDRLDTDIEAANRGGYASAVVMTGVAGPDDIMRAVPQLRPAYICANLEGLNKAQPRVEVSSEPFESSSHDEQGTGDTLRRFTCGAASAYRRSVSSTRVHLEIKGREVQSACGSLDALRAAASAAWDAVDRDGIQAQDLNLPVFSSDLSDCGATETSVSDQEKKS